VKIDIEKILNHSLGTLAAVAVIGGAFVVANKFFGFMSYAGQSPAHIASVIKNLTDNYTVISSVDGHSIWGRDYKRGILMSKSGVLYYYRFEYVGGQPVKISLYPELYETWQTEPALFDSATLL
jgi:hypothetical protein